MATSVTMPQLGETVVEGTITKWLKKEGETVERDEPLFEISTDKVDTEVPSPVGGKVISIKVPEGETVGVGTELAIIESGDGQAATPQAKEPAEPAAAPVTAAQPAATRPVSRVEAAPPPAARAEAPPSPAVTTEAPPDRGLRSQILSPLVRRLAEENQVDLSRVVGTGTGGRITKKDILGYIELGQGAAPGPPTPAATPARRVATPGAREEAIPLTRMRQAIARNMVASMQSTARAWNLVEVNMEGVVRAREAAKDSFRQREGLGLTYMPFVARAVSEALLEFPDVNSELREDQLVLKRYVNLGIAVALDEGLIVPVVKGAESMNLVGLARAINDIAARARSKKLMPDDVQGGTFTITNPGPFGSIISVPIINPPQCAILAFDAVEKRPVVVGDAIAIRHMVYLSMSWDHRIIDGATAAKFLGRVKENLETWDFGPELGLPARAD